MGIQRAGYQTVQSAGKSRKKNVPTPHLEPTASAECELWLLAGGQIIRREGERRREREGEGGRGRKRERMEGERKRGRQADTQKKSARVGEWRVKGEIKAN